MPEVLNITLSDRLKVRNLNHELPEGHAQHNRPVVLEWNSQRYTIPPGAEDVIPFELVKKDFGDPRATDIVTTIRSHPNAMPEFIPDRLTEVRRLQQYYQNSVIKFREYLPGDRTFLEEGISDRAPKVEVYTMAGDRVYTVLDDPIGDRVIAAVPTRSDREATDAQLRSLQQVNTAQQEMLERMEAEIAQLRAGLAANPQTDLGVPVDASADRPAHPIFGGPEAPTSGGEEAAELVLDTRTKRVSRKKTLPEDPTRFEDLPTDRG